MSKIKVIGFDADDTLWVNEPLFQQTEEKFTEFLEDYLSQHRLSQELFKIEIENLDLYGYGIKGYILSMIEAALKITENTVDISVVSKIIELGKGMINAPIEILEGVVKTLESLQDDYRLIVATKGDLLDQERKLAKSGLEKYFHHVEVLSDKKPKDYQKLLTKIECKPENFVMIGNSLKSDVLPVLEVGGYGIHVPFHTTWAHETISHKIENPRYFETNDVTQVIGMIKSINE